VALRADHIAGSSALPAAAAARYRSGRLYLVSKQTAVAYRNRRHGGTMDQMKISGRTARNQNRYAALARACAVRVFSDRVVTPSRNINARFAHGRAPALRSRWLCSATYKRRAVSRNGTASSAAQPSSVRAASRCCVSLRYRTGARAALAAAAYNGAAPHGIACTACFARQRRLPLRTLHAISAAAAAGGGGQSRRRETEIGGERKRWTRAVGGGFCVARRENVSLRCGPAHAHAHTRLYTRTRAAERRWDDPVF